jgi:predicted RNA binding protein YcfA (HicA-like mRNA interferase family)
MFKMPALKDKDLLRVLRKLGFCEHRQRGTSHLILKHPDGRRTVVPMHPGKDIPPGTLHAIIRDVNLASEDLQKLL